MTGAEQVEAIGYIVTGAVAIVGMVVFLVLMYIGMRD